MMSAPIKIAYVVPTKDRPTDLRKLFESLRMQTRMPDQTIIVDGSDVSIEPLCQEFSDLPLTYVRCVPPSLAKQRNRGMAALAPDIAVAGYLDDDLVLDPKATENMVKFWEAAESDVGGASFSIVNQPGVRNERIKRFFLMHGDPPGRVLPSAFPCSIPFVETTLQTEWLYGGATFWRREVIEKFTYDEWFLGHGYLEDLDYSYRVSRTHRLFVVADAKTWHFPGPTSKNRQFELGRQQTFNRFYFVRKMGSFPKRAVARGLLGTVVLNLLALVRHPDGPTFSRVRGNFVGIFAALKGRKESYGGIWKS
jgi:hypothetical protein